VGEWESDYKNIERLNGTVYFGIVPFIGMFSASKKNK
jgi:hypothetical protein